VAEDLLAAFVGVYRIPLEQIEVFAGFANVPGHIRYSHDSNRCGTLIQKQKETYNEVYTFNLFDAGKPHGSHRGYVFSNAWVYNTIESICVALMVDPQGDQEIIKAQETMKATLADWIPKILAAQEPDGYLQTVFTLSDRQRFSPSHRGDHEGYVAGTNIKMVQKTNYPWSGDVSVTVNPRETKSFSVRIRVPNRNVSKLYTGTPQSDGITSISVNGSAITPPVDKGYAVISRKWRAGDKIDLKLPMKVQRIKASNKIEATQGQVALRYGPLIYSAERVDQDIDNVLNPESALTAEWKGDLLGGVMVIKGTWADGSELIAIPNFARGNRDPSDENDRRGRGNISSSVWLKDR